jgi:hypothetical protein
MATTLAGTEAESGFAETELLVGESVPGAALFGRDAPAGTLVSPSGTESLVPAAATEGASVLLAEPGFYRLRVQGRAEERLAAANLRRIEEAEPLSELRQAEIWPAGRFRRLAVDQELVGVPFARLLAQAGAGEPSRYDASSLAGVLLLLGLAGEGLLYVLSARRQPGRPA